MLLLLLLVVLLLLLLLLVLLLVLVILLLVMVMVMLLLLLVFARHANATTTTITLAGRHRHGIRGRLVRRLSLASRATTSFIGYSPAGRRVDVTLRVNPLCPDENLAIPEAFLPRDRTFVACRPRAVAAQASTTAVVTRFAVAWRHAPNAVGAAGRFGGRKEGKGKDGAKMRALRYRAVMVMDREENR